MAKRKESERERLEPPGLRREMRRLDLMDLFRQETDYYLEMQQKLRPHWRAIVDALSHLKSHGNGAHLDDLDAKARRAAFVEFSDCQSAVADPASHWCLRRATDGKLLDALRLYVSGVEAYLMRRRLCFEGHPAEWALQDTHDFISGGDQFSVEVISEQFFTGVEREATFRLSIAPGGAFIARLEEDPNEGRALRYAAAEEINPVPGAGFAEFEEFKQRAHAQIDRWVDEVRASWGDALGTKLVARRRHAGGQHVAEREAKYMKLLFDYLKEGIDLAPKDKQQLREICKDIELTLPSAR